MALIALDTGTALQFQPESAYLKCGRQDATHSGL